MGQAINLEKIYKQGEIKWIMEEENEWHVQVLSNFTYMWF